MAMADACKKKPAPKKRNAPKEYSREVVSASLLAQIQARDPNRKPREGFSLGMSEWMDDADEASGKENCASTSGDDDFKQPTAKKTRLSKQLPLSLNQSTSKNRFAECVTSTELASMTKPLVPKNTQKNTGWALRNFCEWREKRSSE